MPTLLESQPTMVEPPRKRWRRSEFESISDGELASQHLELVEGEIISKMGKHRPHVLVQTRLNAWLSQHFGVEFVNAEAPIDVASEDNQWNEPQPDAIVLKRPQSEILYSNPQPTELSLIVEVSDSSLAFDLTTKARLYARAEIVEYWVIDVPGRRLVVHHDPRNGNYQSVISYSENEPVAPIANPAAILQISQVLP